MAQGLETFPHFLQRDEFLKFKVTYLGITGGYSTLEVIHDVNSKGKEVIHFKLKAWTTPFISAFYKLDLDLHSIVEKENLQTLYYTEYKLEKKKTYQHKMLVFPQKNHFHFYRNITNAQPDAVVPFAQRGYDVVASFYLSRCADFTPGGNLTFDSFFPRQGSPNHGLQFRAKGGQT